MASCHIGSRIGPKKHSGGTQRLGLLPCPEVATTSRGRGIRVVRHMFFKAAAGPCTLACACQNLAFGVSCLHSISRTAFERMRMKMRI